MFETVQEVRAALAAQKYIATDEIATVLFLAEKLGKPLLAEGPAGVGKTELSKAWSAVTGRELVRLQCYEGLDESKALYEWEYAKQMLYTQLLRDKLADLLTGAGSLTDAADRLAQEEDVFFSDRFLLRARCARHQQRRADRPADRRIDRAMRVRSVPAGGAQRFQVSIEIGTIVAKQQGRLPDQQQHPRAERGAQAPLLYLYITTRRSRKNCKSSSSRCRTSRHSWRQAVETVRCCASST